MQPPQKTRLADFFKSEYGRLVGYVRHKIDNVAAQDAEDVVQEVAANLFQKADISAPIENVSAYVFQSLRNEIVDYFRKRKENLSLDQSLPQYQDIRLIDILRDRRNEDLSEIDKQENAEELYRYLSKLTEDERALIIAVELEGYTFKQLAEKWGIPINTLLSRKSRAMSKLLRLTQSQSA